MEKNIDGKIKPKDRGTKARKPPPIHIEIQDPKDIAKLLAKELGISQFFIRRVNSNKHILQLDSESNFTAAKNLLNKAGTNFYTYTHKDNKRPTYVLKGLHNSYSEDEVLEELKSKQMSDITFCKVSRLITKSATDNNTVVPIYIVQLSPDSNTSSLTNIKYIDFQVIKWERLRKKESLQCKRCQRIGHAASNCYMSYRCVKCNEGHGPGECVLPKSTNEKDKLFCANCNEYGYPASYRGCPTVVAKQNLIREKTLNNKLYKQARLKKIGSYVNPGVSFADATKHFQGRSTVNELTKHGSEEIRAPPFKAEKEIQEIKNNLEKFIKDQQAQWAALDRIIRNNAYQMEMLTKAIKKHNG